MLGISDEEDPNESPRDRKSFTPRPLDATARAELALLNKKIAAATGEDSDDVEAWKNEAIELEELINLDKETRREMGSHPPPPVDRSSKRKKRKKTKKRREKEK